MANKANNFSSRQDSLLKISILDRPKTLYIKMVFEHPVSMIILIELSEKRRKWENNLSMSLRFGNIARGKMLLTLNLTLLYYIVKPHFQN